MNKCLNCEYTRQPSDEYIPISPLECPRCGVAYVEISERKPSPVSIPIKIKCLNCGYARQTDDESAFNPETECPKCHAIYEKVERLLLKKEYEKAEKWLAEKECEKSIALVGEEGESREDKIDPQSDIGESQRFEKAKQHFNRGNNAFDTGLYENAIDEYTTAIQLNPSYAKAFANRGLAYRKIKKPAEAVADQKAAARLGSTVAKDDLLKKSRANKIILGTITAIVALIIISAWQDNNEKNQREERQRQEVIAAEQARIKAEQEEQERNRLIRARTDDRFDRKARRMTGEETQADRIEKKLEQMQNDVNRHPLPLDDPMTRMQMESMAEEKAREAVRRDRMLHGHPPY